VGEPSFDEDGGGEECGRAEQKGRIKRDINSQRATLLGWLALGVGGWKDQRKETRDAHALMSTILWDVVELFLERPSQ
jgi:hypothetical protein